MASSQANHGCMVTPGDADMFNFNVFFVADAFGATRA